MKILRQRSMVRFWAGFIVMLIFQHQASEALQTRGLRVGERREPLSASHSSRKGPELSAPGRASHHEDVDADVINAVVDYFTGEGFNREAQIQRHSSKTQLSGIQPQVKTTNGTANLFAPSFFQKPGSEYVWGFAPNHARSPINHNQYYRNPGPYGLQGLYAGQELDPFLAVMRIPWKQEEVDATINLKKECSGSELVIVGRYYTYALLTLIEELGGKNILPHFIPPYETFSTDRFYFSRGI